MSIHAPEASAEYIVLHGLRTTAVIEVRPGEAPLWRFWGPRLPEGCLPMAPLRDGRAIPPASMEFDQPLSVVPTFGVGWYGQSTLLANTVQTPVTDGIIYPLPDNRQTLAADVTSAYSTESIDTQIARAREEMERAAKSLDFLAATKFRDRMYELQKLKESEYKR